MSLIVRMTPKAHPLQFEFVGNLQSFAIWTPILIGLNQIVPFNLDNDGEWKTGFNDIIICCAIGVIDIFAMIFLTLGYQYGEATKVSWMEYLNLPMGYLYQWALFNQPPNIYETVGGSLMAVTCFIELFEECYYWRKEKEDEEVNGDYRELLDLPEDDS